ncbi:MAG TPA: DUF5667 domain-containing protein [Marmoricola sp.]
MKPLIPAHRAAEEFARVVDGHPRDGAADRYAPLADVVTLLRSHEQPDPRPEFAADLRERLMLAAETELVPAPARPAAPSPRRRARRRERPVAALAAALVFVGGSAGVAAAAQGSVPGDPLYPLKRGIEQASVALHTTDASKGADLLGQAATRLDEVRSLVGQGAPAETVNQTLQQFTDTAGQGADLLFRSYQQGGDDQDITRVRSFAHQQMDALSRLSPAAPRQSADAFRQAAGTLAGIDQQARVLCSACSDAGPLALPGALAGPRSTASLTALIQHPTAMAAADARRARALAQAAEAAGRTATRSTPLPGQLPGQQELPSVPGSTTTTSTSSGGTGGGSGSTPVTTGDAQPVQDLLNGVTQKTGGLTNALTDTAEKATGGLGGAVDDTLNGGDPTGDLSKTVNGTVDGTVGGLLGGGN